MKMIFVPSLSNTVVRCRGVLSIPRIVDVYYVHSFACSRSERVAPPSLGLPAKQKRLKDIYVGRKPEYQLVANGHGHNSQAVIEGNARISVKVDLDVNFNPILAVHNQKSIE